LMESSRLVTVEVKVLSPVLGSGKSAEGSAKMY